MTMRTRIAAVALLIPLTGISAFFLVRQTSRGAARSYSSVSYVTDVSDKRRLAGLADNVFVGKVVAMRGVHTPDDIPETLFEVQVTQNLKGTLNGAVLVNQEGGSSQAGTKGTLHLVEGDSLLVVGTEYLLATRYSPSGKWHTIVPRYGDVSLRDRTRATGVIAEFQDAVRRQIRFDPSIDPTFSLGGSYRTRSMVISSTCPNVPLGQIPTQISHDPGSPDVVVTHGGVSYSGTVSADGGFSTAPVTRPVGGAPVTARIAGSVSDSAIDARIVVEVARHPPCQYELRLTGSKIGPRNVIPRPD